MRLSRIASRSLTMVALALYGCAWLLPVVLVPPFFSRNPNAPSTPYYGWHALSVAFGPIIEPAWPDAVIAALGQVLAVVSGLTNVLFIAVAVLLLFAPAREIGNRLESALWLSIPVNLRWLWDPPGELQLGYALWILSFALLALAVRVRRRSALHARLMLESPC